MFFCETCRAFASARRVTLGAAALLAFSACQAQGGQSDVPTQPAPAQQNEPALTSPTESPAQTASPAPGASVTLPNFASLAERLVPAVVSIEVEQRAKVGRLGGPQGRAMPGPFGFFFGDQVPRERESHGLGSGFLIDSQGLILTNQHVVDKADSIEVTLVAADGTERKLVAKVVGEASEYDVALLKTDEDAKAPAVVLGDSDTVRIGEWVMAIGNPFGLEHSVSAGIISAKERRDVAPSGRQGLYNFLQTDASINPGNSGGPLVNTRGEVIGINSAINAQGQGIGFAIPINMVKKMLPELKKGGKFVRSWIGIKIQAMTPELAQSYGLKDAKGVLVAELVKGGPGEQAGLKEGDVIVEFDGNKLLRSSDLPLYASMAGVGKKVPLAVWRDNQIKAVEVKLEAFPEDAATQPAAASAADKGSALGLELGNISPEDAKELGLASSRGALIETIEPGSPAAEAGLARGDVILSVNGAEVQSARDAVRLVSAAKRGEVMRLRIERQQSRIFVALRKP